MSLNSFGAILSFAEELENKKIDFFQTAMQKDIDPETRTLFDALLSEGKKQIKLVQRTRRENVTEMILEPVQNFCKKTFVMETDLSDRSDTDFFIQKAKINEKISLTYYSEASLKLKALPEVARILKQLAKKQKTRLEKLNRL